MSKSMGNVVGPVGRDRPLRRRRAALVLLHLQAALGRLPLLARDDRRGGAPVPAAAVEHLRLLRPLRERQRHRAGTLGRGRPAREQRARPLGALAPRGHDRSRARPHRRLRRDRRRPRDRRRSSTSCPTGTCAARGGASGTAIPPPSRPCTTCLSRWPQLLAPFTPFVADEIYDNLDGGRASVHLRDFPAAGRARRRARGRDGRGARDGAPRPRGPRAGEAQGAPAAARRGGRRHRARARARSSGSPTSCARSSTSASCASSPRPTSSASVEVKPNYRTLGPRFGKQMPLVAAAVAGLDPAHVSAALREGRTVVDQRRRQRPHRSAQTTC